MLWPSLTLPGSPTQEPLTSRAWAVNPLKTWPSGTILWVVKRSIAGCLGMLSICEHKLNYSTGTGRTILILPQA